MRWDEIVGALLCGVLTWTRTLRWSWSRCRMTPWTWATMRRDSVQRTRPSIARSVPRVPWAAASDAWRPDCAPSSRDCCRSTGCTDRPGSRGCSASCRRCRDRSHGWSRTAGTASTSRTRCRECLRRRLDGIRRLDIHSGTWSSGSRHDRKRRPHDDSSPSQRSTSCTVHTEHTVHTRQYCVERERNIRSYCWLLHFAWVVDVAKCIAVTRFCKK